MNLTRATFLNGSNELPEHLERYRGDAIVIQKALVKYGFVNAGLTDAIGLWGEYSDSMAAGWIGGADPRDVEYYDSEDEHLDGIYERIEMYIRKYVYPLNY